MAPPHSIPGVESNLPPVNMTPPTNVERGNIHVPKMNGGIFTMPKNKIICVDNNIREYHRSEVTNGG